MKLKKHNPKMGLVVPLKVIAAKGMSSGKTTVKCARRSCGSKELPFPTSFNAKGDKSSSQRHANVVGIHFARIGWIGLHNHSTTEPFFVCSDPAGVLRLGSPSTSFDPFRSPSASFDSIRSPSLPFNPLLRSPPTCFDPLRDLSIAFDRLRSPSTSVEPPSVPLDLLRSPSELIRSPSGTFPSIHFLRSDSIPFDIILRPSVLFDLSRPSSDSLGPLRSPSTHIVHHSIPFGFLRFGSVPFDTLRSPFDLI